MIDRVQMLLQQHGWRSEQLDGETLGTAFTVTLPEGGDRSLPLYITSVTDDFGDHYVRLCVVPFVDQPTDGYPQSLFIGIAQINHDLPRLKLAIDDNGNMELLLDLPEGSFDSASFNAGLQTLTDYAGAFYSRLATAVAVEDHRPL